MTVVPHSTRSPKTKPNWHRRGGKWVRKVRENSSRAPYRRRALSWLQARDLADDWLSGKFDLKWKVIRKLCTGRDLARTLEMIMRTRPSGWEVPCTDLIVKHSQQRHGSWRIADERAAQCKISLKLGMSPGRETSARMLSRVLCYLPDWTARRQLIARNAYTNRD